MSFLLTFSRYRIICLIAVLAPLFFLSSGISTLKITTDNRVFYGKDNPYFRDFLKFEETFTSNDNVIFVIDGRAATTKQLLAAVEWVTQRSYTLSSAIRVDSLTNYPIPKSSDDTFFVSTVAEEACRVDVNCTAGLSGLARDLNLTNRLISGDLKSAGIIATLNIERGQPDLIEKSQEEIHALSLAFHRLFPDLQLLYTGGVPMMAAFASASSDDLGRLLPTTFALVCFLSLAFLRSLRLTSILIFTGIVAASATMGLASFIGMTINNATSIAPIVVFVLVISVSMHTIMRFKSVNPNPGDTIEQARRAIEQTVAPLNISVATSVISLLSLVLVDSPPIKELGFLSAIGLVIGYILTITVVPILLTFSGARKRPGIFDHPNRSTIISKIMPSFTKGRLSILLLAALLLLSGGVLRIDIDDDFVEYFDDSVSFRTQTELATQLLTGPNHIEVILTADSGSTVFDPKFLEYTAILTERIRLFPKIRNAFSFSDVTFQIGRALQLDHPLSGLSESDIHQIFLAYELSLRQGQSNTDLISLDHKSARISLLLDKTSSRDVQDLEEAIKLTHRSLGSPYAISITGENIPVAHLSQINIHSMVKGLAIAGLLIGAITAIKLRSLPSGVLACFAVALPIFAGFGLWGFLKGDIGISATAILALTMGIVVDDNVHFLHNFFQAMRESSRNITESVVESMSRTFPAIFATSTILGAGLAVLSLSHFEVNRSFGLVTSVIALLALLTTRGILPYLTISYFHALPSRSRSTATKFDR